MKPEEELDDSVSRHVFETIAATYDLEKLRQVLVSEMEQLEEAEALFEVRFRYEQEKENFSWFITKRDMPLTIRWLEELREREMLASQHQQREPLLTLAVGWMDARQNTPAERLEDLFEAASHHQRGFAKFFALKKGLQIAFRNFDDALDLRDPALQDRWLDEWTRVKAEFITLAEQWLRDYPDRSAAGEL